MANVNLETKQIYGCEIGTKTYYHEEGHLKFQDSTYGNGIRICQDLSVKSLIFVLALNVLQNDFIFKIMIVCLLLTSIFSEIYEEMWCWNYANKKLKNANTNKRSEV